MVVNLTIKDFCNRFRKLSSETETDLAFFMLLKGNPIPKCTVTTISCHEIVFYILVSKLAPFAFTLIYFGIPFDLIPIVSTIHEKLVELYTLYIFLY